MHATLVVERPCLQDGGPFTNLRVRILVDHFLASHSKAMIRPSMQLAICSTEMGCRSKQQSAGEDGSGCYPVEKDSPTPFSALLVAHVSN